MAIVAVTATTVTATTPPISTVVCSVAAVTPPTCLAVAVIRRLVTHRVLPLICIGPPRGSQGLGVLLIASTCLVVVLGSWWEVWRGVSLERTSALRGRQVNLLSEEPTDRNTGTSTTVCLLRVLHVMDSGEVAV